MPGTRFPQVWGRGAGRKDRTARYCKIKVLNKTVVSLSKCEAMGLLYWYHPSPTQSENCLREHAGAFRPFSATSSRGTHDHPLREGLAPGSARGSDW